MTGLGAERIQVGAGGRLVVDGVDCTAQSGTVTAVIGPNGAGKSTLLRALAAVSRPDSGTVRYGDQDAFALPRRQRARLAALVEQDATTELDLTVADSVALGRLPHEGLWGADLAERDRVVTESLEAVGMVAFADRRVTSLSGGERQRALLAKALAQATPLLLLDEPTNHLDIAAQLATLALLRSMAASGTTVLAALHDLGHAAAYSDSVLVLAGGRVVAAGPTQEVLVPDLIRRVYGVDAVVLTHPGTGRPVLALSEPAPVPTR
ncbi:ABC transporter ATP-binding protein [Naasia aerilata]|uniref:ABC transporter ATP-binding protein n=1 Tax=Naasia aerilata TaxID=1162966 RepID=A0ABM8GDF6_9MICO|nr:ATP-binding cassette domain-containing protein [Naasia aerilata]BDZ46316.1 ABC transporter ATP-binding protein [Naasia aerilata]